MRRLYAQSGAVVRAAFEAGVPVYAGTDAGGGIAHGSIAAEVRALHEAGLPAEAALAAASWSARTWLGLGGIEEGAPADVVVYDPAGHTSIGAGEGRSHHMNMDHSAWEGYEIDGHVDVVVSRGSVVVSDGTFHGRAGHGRYLKRGLTQYLT